MTFSTLRTFPSLAAVLIAASSPTVSAQCSTHWTSVSAVPGADGPVLASVTWDPDGAGPLEPRLVVGGQFEVVGNVAANCIAMFDPSTGTWQPFGAPLDADVQALVVLPNGDLVAGGAFVESQGTLLRHVARWDGTQWQPFGIGTNDVVYALAG